MMSSAARAFAALCLLTACGQPVDTSDRRAAGQTTRLPSLNRDGAQVRFMRYADARENSGNGRVFFLHPVMEPRNGVLALEGSPQGDPSALFAEDALGISGLVSAHGGKIRIDFLPISLPVGVRSGQAWQLTFARRTFSCRSRDDGPENRAVLRVSCRSPDYELNFLFERERGILEYDDFCGASVCTFRLLDARGLLSREVLQFMGLPEI
jgi:hypothetical protein